MFQRIVRNVISNQLVKIVFFLTFPEFNESLFSDVVELECKDSETQIEKEIKDAFDSLFLEGKYAQECTEKVPKRVPRDCTIQFKISSQSILRGQVFTLIVVVFWSLVGYIGLGFYPKILNILVDDGSLYKELSGEWILDYFGDHETTNIINHFVEYRQEQA